MSEQKYLPYGWYEKYSNTRGHPYYYNKFTHERIWTRPALISTRDYMRQKKEADSQKKPSHHHDHHSKRKRKLHVLEAKMSPVTEDDEPMKKGCHRSSSSPPPDGVSTKAQEPSVSSSTFSYQIVVGRDVILNDIGLLERLLQLGSVDLVVIPYVCLLDVLNASAKEQSQAVVERILNESDPRIVFEKLDDSTVHHIPVATDDDRVLNCCFTYRHLAAKAASPQRVALFTNDAGLVRKAQTVSLTVLNELSLAGDSLVPVDVPLKEKVDRLFSWIKKTKAPSSSADPRLLTSTPKVSSRDPRLLKPGATPIVKSELNQVSGSVVPPVTKPEITVLQNVPEDTAEDTEQPDMLTTVEQHHPSTSQFVEHHTFNLSGETQPAEQSSSTNSIPKLGAGGPRNIFDSILELEEERMKPSPIELPAASTATTTTTPSPKKKKKRKKKPKSGGAPIDPKTMYCEFCKLQCPSVNDYEAHLAGKKHKKKMLPADERIWSVNVSRGDNCYVCGVSGHFAWECTEGGKDQLDDTIGTDDGDLVIVDDD